MSPRQHLHKGSIPVCSTCFPTLPSQGGDALFPSSHSSTGQTEGVAVPSAKSQLALCVLGLGMMCGQQSMVRFTGDSWHSKAALGVSTEGFWVFIIIFCGALFSHLVHVGTSRVMLERI